MHLLFVCTGNTCRSPLAEVIARRQIAERQLPDVTVGSAGTSAWPDAPASDGALLVALEHGMDLGEH
ncbi:MAG: low molecular weight phosphatase family protein, partial [Gemmatimonadaceae bacterium]